jgi:hypothetical protein
MQFPIRVVLALFVIGGVRGIVAVLRAARLTESQRMIAVGGIAIVAAPLAAWVVFVWPPYWD